MYEVTVTNYKGMELDHKQFETEQERKDYIAAEWSGTDNCIELK